MASQSDNDADRLLAIYLNDHRAGAVGGLALARRIVRQIDSSEARQTVGAIADEIAADRRTLERVARALGVRPNPVKMAAARVAERAGLLKLNGRLVRRSPLSGLLELEGLMAGIEAKRALWTSLSVAGRPELAEIDFEQLASRATEQRTRLMAVHRSVAVGALREARPTMRAVR